MFKKIIFSLITVTIIIGIYTQIFSGSNQAKIKEILKKDVFLVDVRTPEEFKAGTVKGAVNIPLDQLSNDLSKFKGQQHIILFCRTGNRSGIAQKILKENGFENVYNGGAWTNLKELINE
jgi:rhodanese-related sulfurtransferase